MAYRIEVSIDASKQLKKLDKGIRERLFRFLLDRIAKLEDPRSLAEALKGTRLGELWKYRVGDYRMICNIEDARIVVVVLRIGPRREVYR
jgi:mRNA interferase RelE/StbE